jgi:cytochrome c-type biogenesis protein CcsB
VHVNATLAQASDTLLVVAVVVYALAMLAFAVELAFGRVAVPAADGPPAAGRASWTRRVGTSAIALTVLGWLAHVGSVSTRGLSESRVPWGNMYEFSSMVALIAVTVFLVVVLAPPSARRFVAVARDRARRLGLFVMLAVVVYLGLAGTVLYAPPGPLVPALHSYWIKIHVVAAITASGAFMISGIVTILYLVREHWERRGGRREPAPGEHGAASLGPGAASTYELSATTASRRGILARLPSSATLDRLALRVVAFAFPIWTFAIMAGAIWARAAWGRYWGWDPK